MTKHHQTQIKLTQIDCEVLHLALSNLQGNMSPQQRDARERLLKRLEKADQRLGFPSF